MNPDNTLAAELRAIIDALNEVARLTRDYETLLVAATGPTWGHVEDMDALCDTIASLAAPPDAPSSAPNESKAPFPFPGNSLTKETCAPWAAAAIQDSAPRVTYAAVEKRRNSVAGAWGAEP